MTKRPELTVSSSAIGKSKDLVGYQVPPQKLYGTDQSADTGVIETFEVILTRKADYGTSRYIERVRTLKAK